MRTIDIFARAGRSLKQAKLRTLFTSLAIAVGAFTLTAAMAAGEGARQYASSLIGDNINPQALFIVADKGLFDGSVQQGGLREYENNVSNIGGTTLKLITQADIDKLSKRDDLKNVVPVYNMSSKYIQFQDSDKRFTSDLYAYDDTITTTVAAGNLPKMGEQIAKDEVLVPESFVELLKEKQVVSSTEELIGREVTITVSNISPVTGREETREIKLKIRAVAKKPANALTAINGLQVSSDKAREIAEFTTKGTPQFQKYFGVTGLVVDDKEPSDIKGLLEKEGYAVQTPEDAQELIFTVVNVLQGIVAGFGLLALIASVFGIINTQYISVLERTQQIGLMKALGMRGRHVSRLFQFEAAWIGIIGGVIGSGLAVLVGTLMNPWITDKLGLGEGNYLLIFQPLLIVALVVVLALVAMLAGYFPARKAARLDPIEALRTE